MTDHRCKRRALPVAGSADDEDETVDRGAPTLDERAMAVEVTIQQAMRRGDFDGLPGAGKPLTGLGGVRRGRGRDGGAARGAGDDPLDQPPGGVQLTVRVAPPDRR